MRQWLTLIVVLLAGTLMAGCSYTPARIDPEPIIEVGDGHYDHDYDRDGHDHDDYDRDYDHDQGGFCPPGQAKKGNC